MDPLSAFTKVERFGSDNKNLLQNAALPPPPPPKQQLIHNTIAQSINQEKIVNKPREVKILAFQNKKLLELQKSLKQQQQ
jgi:hypothetical protein